MRTSAFGDSGALARLRRMTVRPSIWGLRPHELPAWDSDPPPVHQHDPLLAAVIAQPLADAPRIAYAQGAAPARRAFILAQLAGATATADPVWLAPLARYSPRHVVYRRGFVEELSLAGRAFLAHGAAIVQLAPIRKVHLVAIAPYMDELLQSPLLNLNLELDLTGNRIDPALLKQLHRARRAA
jgi:hypothetical protein